MCVLSEVDAMKVRENRIHVGTTHHMMTVILLMLLVGCGTLQNNDECAEICMHCPKPRNCSVSEILVVDGDRCNCCDECLPLFPERKCNKSQIDNDNLLTLCQQGLKMKYSFRCDDLGFFLPVQCSQNHCWCSDPSYGYRMGLKISKHLVNESVTTCDELNDIWEKSHFEYPAVMNNIQNEISKEAHTNGDQSDIPMENIFSKTRKYNKYENNINTLEEQERDDENFSNKIFSSEVLQSTEMRNKEEKCHPKPLFAETTLHEMRQNRSGISSDNINVSMSANASNEDLETATNILTGNDYTTIPTSIETIIPVKATEQLYSSSVSEDTITTVAEKSKTSPDIQQQIEKQLGEINTTMPTAIDIKDLKSLTTELPEEDITIIENLIETDAPIHTIEDTNPIFGISLENEATHTELEYLALPDEVQQHYSEMLQNQSEILSDNINFTTPITLYNEDLKVTTNIFTGRENTTIATIIESVIPIHTKQQIYSSPITEDTISTVTEKSTTSQDVQQQIETQLGEIKTTMPTAIDINNVNEFPEEDNTKIENLNEVTTIHPTQETYPKSGIHFEKDPNSTKAKKSTTLHEIQEKQMEKYFGILKTTMPTIFDVNDVKTTLNQFTEVNHGTVPSSFENFTKTTKMKDMFSKSEMEFEEITPSIAAENFASSQEIQQNQIESPIGNMITTAHPMVNKIIGQDNTSIKSSSEKVTSFDTNQETHLNSGMHLEEGSASTVAAKSTTLQKINQQQEIQKSTSEIKATMPTVIDINDLEPTPTQFIQRDHTILSLIEIFSSATPTQNMISKPGMHLKESNTSTAAQKSKTLQEIQLEGIQKTTSESKATVATFSHKNDVKSMPNKVTGLENSTIQSS